MSGAAATPASGQVSVGHPVDVATGRLYHDFEDHVQPGRMPLVFGRRYSSTRGKLEARDGLLSIFGPGWSSPFEMRIRRSADGYSVLGEDGEHETAFWDYGTFDEGGTLLEPSTFSELRRVGSGPDAQVVLRRFRPDEDVVEFVFERDPRATDQGSSPSEERTISSQATTRAPRTSRR